MNKKTLDMLDLSNPDLDFVGLATALGVTGYCATTADEFNQAFERAMNEPGPKLIEAILDVDVTGLG